MSGVIKKLANAPDIYFIPFPTKTDEVYIDVYFRGGMYDEPKKDAGLTHTLEHYLWTMFGEKVNYSIETNAQVSGEASRFYIETTQHKAIAHMQAFFNSLFTPDFTNQDVFNRERLTIINELNTAFNDTEDRLHYIFRRTLFGEESPVARSFEEEVRNIKKFSLQTCARKHEELLSSGNIVIFIGAYLPSQKFLNEIVNLVKRYHFSVSPETNHKKLAVPKRLVKHATLAGRRGTYVYLVYPGYTLDDVPEKRIAQSIFSQTFTHISNSEVFKKLRERGIYSISYRNNMCRRFGLTMFFTHLETGKETEFVSIVRKGLKKIQKDGLNPERLKERIKQARQDIERRWKDNDKRYGDIIDDILNGHSAFTLNDSKKCLEKIDNNHMKKIAKEFFNEKNMNTLTIGARKPKLK